ncbi:hypothetical protein HCR_16380 [Hydrogenimonas cancrithermarum]|uniref:DUF4136 domain-containing protein n=2 Tax=Hydrogenimonas cancrithermarum TaxID=2993563 RepID=A0ABM8FLS9_9BACT|nr:hypothetical protein HCR_16380 [Hydrogenimonas cancrithermarum]
MSVTLFFAGCAGKNGVSDYDPDYPIQRLQTFVVKQNGASGISPLDGERIEAAIVQTLRAKGYTAAATGVKNDFVVEYAVTIRKDVPSNVSFGFGFGSFGRNIGASVGTSVTPRHDEATIQLHMIDPATRKVFWSASDTKRFETADDPHKRAAFFKARIREMLAAFPNARKG